MIQLRRTAELGPPIGSPSETDRECCVGSFPLEPEHFIVTRFLRSSLIVLMGIASASCTASYPTQPTKATPTALYLAYAAPKGRAAPGTNSVINGYSFFAYTLDSDGAFERVSERVVWSSSDDGILRPLAGVSSAGVKSFLAISPGSADVIARLEGLQATAPTLIVHGDVVSRTPRIDLSWNGQGTVGSLSKATAFLRPQTGSQRDVSNSATWSSSDPAVATVGEGGAIRAVGAGTTIITANVDGLVDWFWFSVRPLS